MSEIMEIDGPGRFQTKKRLDKPAGLLSWHHTRPLNSLKNILSEQSRIYRAVINGAISTGEGTRLVFMLKEIRGTWEALAASNAAVLAKAEAATAVQAAAAPINISITSIPSGHFLQSDGSFAPMTDAMQLQIEHAPQKLNAPAPVSDKEFTPQNEREMRLLAELEALSPEELLQRARDAGFTDVDAS